MGQDEMNDPRIIEVFYTNHKGETELRRLAELVLTTEPSEWHPNEYYIIHAFDVDKCDYRHFALSGFRGTEAVAQALATLQPAAPDIETTTIYDPDCEACHDSGEYYTHSQNCHNPFCVLAGGPDDCDGEVVPCDCGVEMAPVAAVKALVSQPAAPAWIRVSERLPDITTSDLATGGCLASLPVNIVDDRDDIWLAQFVKTPNGHQWIDDIGTHYHGVVAWCAIPARDKSLFAASPESVTEGIE